jgi:hypothetical protein
MNLKRLLLYLAVLFLNFFATHYAFMAMTFPNTLTFVMGLTGLVLLLYFDARFVKREFLRITKKSEKETIPNA